MSRRVTALPLLLAWLFASGSQWDVVQVFAWGQMFSGYVKIMSVAKAAEKTFRGDLCSLCKSVADAKKTDQPAAGSEFMKSKPMMAPADEGTLVPRPAQREAWPAPVHTTAASRRVSPPTPPPKTA